MKSLFTILALKPKSTMNAIIMTAIPTAIEAIPNFVTVAEKLLVCGFRIRLDMKRGRFKILF